MTVASHITLATELSPHSPVTVARLGFSAKRHGLRVACHGTIEGEVDV